MARYYHTLSDSLGRVSDHKIVAAHDDKGSENVPAGIIHATHYPEHFIPNFINEPETVREEVSPQGTDFAALANHTGYSLPYLMRVRLQLGNNDNATTSELQRYENLLNAGRMRKSAWLGQQLKADDVSAKNPSEDYANLVRDRQNLRKTNIKAARAISNLQKDPGFGPTQLFTDTPNRLKITYASFHPNARTLFPTAVSLAAHLAGDNPQIVADRDLSAQSSRVAQHAAKKGLVTGSLDNPNMEQSNDMPWYPVTVTDPSALRGLDQNPWSNDAIRLETEGHVGHYSRVPEKDVTAARQNMRQMLRGNRQPSQKLSSQFDHPMLPGFE